MRRWVVLGVVYALVVPAPAVAKDGAMFNPQLISLPAGQSNRLELYVMPVDDPHRRVPAPPVGAVPVVTLRALHGTGRMQFVGTPLDRNRRSLVTVSVPASAASRHWVASVRAGGHVYPDRIDSPLTITARPLPVSVPAPSQSRPDTAQSGGVSWRLVLGLVCVFTAGSFAVIRSRRRSGRPLHVAGGSEAGDPR
jgi:hypothetical protein